MNMRKLMRNAAKAVMGFGIFMAVLAVSKNVARADMIYYPNDAFQKEHKQQCEELEDAGTGGMMYTVSGEGVTSYVSPESEEKVNDLENGSRKNIYYLFKQLATNKIWGCIDAGEWVPMDKLVKEYNETDFMRDYEAEIKDTKLDRKNDFFMVPEVKGYDVTKVDKMYLYPGYEYVREWKSAGQPNYGYTMMPSKVYTDKDGKNEYDETTQEADANGTYGDLTVYLIKK